MLLAENENREYALQIPAVRRFVDGPVHTINVGGGRTALSTFLAISGLREREAGSVPLEGLEPPTLSLGRNCSSIELQRLTG